MHFRILKMIATSGFLTALECTKFDFGPSGRAYSAPQDPLTGLRGPTSKGRGGKETGKEEKRRRGRGRGGTGNGGNGKEGEGMPEKREERGRKGERKGGEGREGKKSKNTPSVNSCLRPWSIKRSRTLLRQPSCVHQNRHYCTLSTIMRPSN